MLGNLGNPPKNPKPGLAPKTRISTSRALERILWEPTSESIFVARLRVDLLQSYEYSSNHAREMYFKASWGVRGGQGGSDFA